jgi:tetratricopeptide (TPR) repeat protein
MMHARLEELAPEARRVLRAASVFGDLFWRGGVLALLGDDGIAGEVEGWIEHLVTHEVVLRRVESRFPGQAELAFRHALVREAAYATLTEGDRALGHRLAARWLRASGEPDPLVVAEHLERGGARADAAQPFLEAAEDALAASDLGAALARAARGVACGATGERLGRLRLVEAEAASWRGQLSDAERAAHEALEALPRGSPLWYAAAGELASVAGRLDHWERMEELGRRLLGDLTRKRTPPRSLVVAAARTGVGLLFGGRYALGGDLVQRVDAVAGELAARDPAIAAVLHRARAIRALSLGDQAAGLLHWPAAVRSCEEAGDLRGACQARGNLANRFKVLGGYAQAEALLLEVLPAAERLGVYTVVALARQNLGVVRAALGALDDALAIEREAVRDFVAQGDHRLEGASRTYVARILLSTGDAAGAELEALAAVERTLTTLPAHALALATLAEARLALGKREEALADARAAKRELDKLGGLDEGDSIVRLAHARVLAAAGLDEEAAEAAAQARARLLAAADTIADPVWRASFLENVPENRATLALP